MNRFILHVDANGFYASCEIAYNPSLRGKPMVVGGDPVLRHGIVLAKSEEAKKYKIKTGETIRQALDKCPWLLILKPTYKRYERFSKRIRAIFYDYTPLIEPFGLDEAWLDITGSCKCWEDAVRIADAIRQRVKDELGITVSVGVADNKIFAKLGSDVKKPDATTLITPENYKDVVWPLPVGDLLMVGQATVSKLFLLSVITIGDLACASPDLLKRKLGINGLMIQTFARGLDRGRVSEFGEYDQEKSIGHSTTTPRDLVCQEDVKVTVYALAEAVVARMRKHGWKARTVELSVRDNELTTFTRQAKLKWPSVLSGEIADLALAIFERNYRWEKPIRSIGVKCSDLMPQEIDEQISFFQDEERRASLERLEDSIRDIRRRYGYFSVGRGMMYLTPDLSHMDAEKDHTIHPVAYRR